MSVGSSAPVPGPRVQIRLFGSFEASLDGEPLRFPTRKIEALLAFLILHPEAHDREKLAALFWGEVSDQRARVSLRYALARLRKALGDDLLTAGRESVQLNPNFPMWVDAHDYPFQSAELVTQNYRGELLRQFYGDWIVPDRERFRQAYLEALLQLTQQYRSSSEYARAIETAQRALEADPANERAYQHLMFCFLAQGDRQAALRQYELCVRALQQELGIDPAPQTTALKDWIRQAHDPSSSMAARITNLPIPLTSFAGREQEMAAVKGLLRIVETGETAEPSAETTPLPVRLLTLTGAGGSGKTRLAIQAATDLIDAYPDGVWWVELAPLADGALVALAVANALGVREVAGTSIQQTVLAFLRERQMLLLVDNCEHLLEACALLADALLRTCPGLRLLMTSREPLGIEGEASFPVSSLSFPGVGESFSLANLTTYSAINLFTDRARLVMPSYALSASNAAPLTRLCQRIDGIPLAIEMAAARVNLLSTEQLADRLDNALGLLTGGSRMALPRQQSLRATIDWSYDLLQPDERILLSRLAIFAGSFTLEAVEGVCGGVGLDTGHVLDILASLAAKSLVDVDNREVEVRRYGLLGLVRQYAQEKLEASGDRPRMEQQRAKYYLALSMAAEGPLWKGPGQTEWLTRLQAEMDNLRASMAWSLTPHGDSAIALGFAGSLSRFWDISGMLTEGRRWLTALLERAPARSLERVKALIELSFLAHLLGNPSSQWPPALEAMDVAIELGDNFSVGCCSMALGAINVLSGDLDAGETLLERAMEEARRSGHTGLLTSTLTWQNFILWGRGQREQAFARQIKVLELMQASGDRSNSAQLLFNLGWWSWQLGESASALDYLRGSLNTFAAMHDWAGIAACISEQACVAAGRSDWKRATCLFGAAEAVRRALGAQIRPGWQTDPALLLEQAHGQLGGETYAALLATGQRMAPEEAMAYALTG